MLYLLYSRVRRCYFLYLIKKNYLQKTFFRNLMSLDELKNLDALGIPLLIFSSKSNLKLHNISVTPKLDKNIITNVDLSKASGPYYIPIVVLKNCKPEFSYILVELFYMCLKESCLHIVGRFH